MTGLAEGLCQFLCYLPLLGATSCLVSFHSSASSLVLYGPLSVIGLIVCWPLLGCPGPEVLLKVCSGSGLVSSGAGLVSMKLM